MSAALSSSFLDEALKSQRALEEWDRLTLEERAENHRHFDRGLHDSRWSQYNESSWLYAAHGDAFVAEEAKGRVRRAKPLKLAPSLSPIAQVDCMKLMVSNERNKNGTGAGIIAHRTCKVFVALMHHINWQTGLSVPTSRERLMDPEECGYTSYSTITMALDELVAAGVCRRVGRYHCVQVEMLFRTVNELRAILLRWRASPVRLKREADAAKRAREVRSRQLGSDFEGLIPTPSKPVGSDFTPTRIDPRDSAPTAHCLSSHLQPRVDLEGARDLAPAEVTPRAEPAEVSAAAPGASDTRDRTASAALAPPALPPRPEAPAPARASTPPAGRARDGSHGGRESTGQAKPQTTPGASIRKNAEDADEKIGDAFKRHPRATAPPVSHLGVPPDWSVCDAVWAGRSKSS